MPNDKISSVHYSPDNGVHADRGVHPNKEHLPFIGQTTLPTFKIGGTPGPQNDQNLGNLGGTIRLPK